MLPPSTDAPDRARRLTVAASVLIFLTAAIALAAWGGPHDAATGALILLDRLVTSLWPAALYILAAIGLGRPILFLLARAAPSPARPALQAALGLALLLWLSHALGTLGLLALPALAWAPLVLGLALLAHQLFSALQHKGVSIALSPLALPGALALAVLLVAAINPPGWLWDSEFRGYDALAYHLLLPHHWVQSGRIAPDPTNVYSTLPSYLEAAFTHLGSISTGPRSSGLLGHEGAPLIACQLLHALCHVLAAWITSHAARLAATRLGLPDASARSAGTIAAVIVLGTPWAIVTGSLAYNEMALLALSAGATLAALDTDLPAPPRWLAAGLLVGAACSVKPTALLFVAPPVALLLLATTPARHWFRAAFPGALAGLAMLTPWLLRNWSATHNPVFPFAASLFPSPTGGTGWWSAEQVTRYNAGHHFSGSWPQRLALLFIKDPADPMGPTHRGLFHEQWSLFFPVLFLAMIESPLRFFLSRRGSALPLPPPPQPLAPRILAALLASIPLQLLAWLLATHLQSRFLLPTLVPGAILIALALAAPVTRWRTPLLGGALGLALALHATWLFVRQSDFHPNRLLVAGPAARTGEGFTPDEQRRILPDAGPELYTNLAFARGSRTYLLGDAAALYYTGAVTSNSTWDAWPIADAMAAAPADPARWTTLLRERGFDFALINTPEVDRLARSGWIDPRLDLPALGPWMTRHTRLVRAWPELGVYLVELREPERAP